MFKTPLIIAAWLLLIAHNVQAQVRVAVLDFELNDLTQLPRTSAELQRTASLTPMLKQELAETAGFVLIPIHPQVQLSANPGLAYLFTHHQLAAQLGRQYGADWVIIGQHIKPSFLFSYLIVKLVPVADASHPVQITMELKGNNSKVMQRGVHALAEKIMAYWY